MTHELSPVQYAESVGLSDDVLERAAEAMSNTALSYCDCETCNAERLDAALTVIAPAIREALVREMIADAGDAETSLYAEPFADTISLADWIASYLYLPAAEVPTDAR